MDPRSEDSVVHGSNNAQQSTQRAKSGTPGLQSKDLEQQNDRKQDQFECDHLREEKAPHGKEASKEKTYRTDKAKDRKAKEEGGSQGSHQYSVTGIGIGQDVPETTCSRGLCDLSNF
jgi:hypothetical protein